MPIICKFGIFNSFREANCNKIEKMTGLRCDMSIFHSQVIGMSLYGLFDLIWWVSAWTRRQ